MNNIMIQGTTSSAGKSLLSIGLCRILVEDGYSVSPFKSQNMTSEYFLTKDKLKISGAQALQAIACKKEASVDMNPILLCPTKDHVSKVIVRGEEKTILNSKEYFEYRNGLVDIVKDSYKNLEKTSDIVVLEGGGSPAEINLRKRDIVNMGMANMVDAPVILVASIDLGGVFASLYGTVKLLSDLDQSRIKGLVINKFRGDIDILKPGIEMIEELLDIPVLGVIPYTEVNYLEERTLRNYYKTSEKALEDNKKREEEINNLASLLRENLDMARIYRIIGVGDD